jgi:hypothetical protein
MSRQFRPPLRWSRPTSRYHSDSGGIIHDYTLDWLQLASLAAQFSGGGKLVLADADPRPVGDA